MPNAKVVNGKPVEREFTDGSSPERVTLMEDGTVVCTCPKYETEKKCGHRSVALGEWAEAGLFVKGKDGAAPVPPPSAAQPTLPIAEPAAASTPPPAAPPAPPPADPPKAPPAAEAANGNGSKVPTGALALRPDDVNVQRFMDFLETSDVPAEFAGLPDSFVSMQKPVIEGLPTAVDWRRILKFSAVLIRSGFVKKDKDGNPVETLASLTVRIMLGIEYGFTALESYRNVYATEDGQVGLYAKAMIALCLRKIPGLKITTKVRSTTECVMEFSRPGQEPQTFRFGQDDAERQGLTKKWNYRAIPEEMYFSRCASKGCNAYCGDAIGSARTIEELDDIRTLQDAEARERAAAAPPPPVASGAKDPTEVLSR